ICRRSLLNGLDLAHLMQAGPRLKMVVEPEVCHQQAHKSDCPDQRSAQRESDGRGGAGYQPRQLSGQPWRKPNEWLSLRMALQEQKRVATIPQLVVGLFQSSSDALVCRPARPASANQLTPGK